jgi:hypothetical protein
MFETMLFVALISAGGVIVVQGILLRRRPQRARPIFLERPLFDVLDLQDPDEKAKILSRLRIVYGVFFIFLGLWGLFF